MVAGECGADLVGVGEEAGVSEKEENLKKFGERDRESGGHFRKGIRGRAKMEIPPPNERYHPSLQRWRPNDLLAFSPQLSPGGMASNVGDSKFILDDSILSELMDLDPLCDQTGEPWVAGPSEYGQTFMAFSPNFSPPLFSPMTMSPPNSMTCTPHHMSSQANASLVMPAQLSPGDYLLQEAFGCSPPRLLEQPQPSEVYVAAAMSPGSQENFAAMSHMYLPQQVQGAPSDGRDCSNAMDRPNLYTEDSMLGARPGFAGKSPPVPGVNVGMSWSRDGFQEDYVQMMDPSSRDSFEREPQYGLVPSQPGSRKRFMLSGMALPLRERMMEALRLIGKSCVDVLAQVWMPVRLSDDRLVLSTKEQPYVLEHKTDRLSVYRTVSERIDFSVSGGAPGLPGRVFLQQVPEWTPNVQFYSIREYLRVKEAQRCDVKGTLAVPVFESTSRNCLAVIELVMRAEKVQYAPEIDIICRALQVY